MYPVENERDLIEKSVIVTLTKSSKSLLPKDFSGKIYYKCLFGENPKLKFSEYVEQSETDLVIVHTRKKRGLFESSFAQYVNGHTNVSMIFLKNR